MILGLGTDICPASRWERLVDRYGNRPVERMLGEEEARMLMAGHPRHFAERLAGRWALREAFGKALGTGMEGWNWRELRYQDGHLWAEGALKVHLDSLGVKRMHGSLSHDGAMAFAVVILETRDVF